MAKIDKILLSTILIGCLMIVFGIYFGIDHLYVLLTELVVILASVWFVVRIEDV